VNGWLLLITSHDLTSSLRLWSVVISACLCMAVTQFPAKFSATIYVKIRKCWHFPEFQFLQAPPSLILTVLNFLTFWHDPQGVFFKLAPLKLFGIFSLRLRVFFREILQICWQFIFTSTNFCKFILIFHQMVLIFPRVPIVFTLSRK